MTIGHMNITVPYYLNMIFFLNVYSGGILKSFTGKVIRIVWFNGRLDHWLMPQIQFCSTKVMKI